MGSTIVLPDITCVGDSLQVLLQCNGGTFLHQTAPGSLPVLPLPWEYLCSTTNMAKVPTNMLARSLTCHVLLIVCCSRCFHCAKRHAPPWMHHPVYCIYVQGRTLYTTSCASSSSIYSKSKLLPSQHTHCIWTALSVRVFVLITQPEIKFFQLHLGMMSARVACHLLFMHPNSILVGCLTAFCYIHLSSSYMYVHVYKDSLVW